MEFIPGVYFFAAPCINVAIRLIRIHIAFILI